MQPVKFLTGAPEVNLLNWNDADAVNEFLPAFRRFLASDYELESSERSEIISSQQESFPKWRSISLHDSEPGQGDRVVEIRDSERREDNEGNENDEMEFLEHSIAVFEGEPGQQPQINPAEDLDTSIEEPTPNETSFLTSTTSSLPPPTAPPPIHLPRTIADLRTLRSPHSQNRTVNLLAAVISASAPRTVQLRRRAGVMTLVELVVGDETAAGFPVTLWLAAAVAAGRRGAGPRDGRTARDEALRRAATALRRRDVVVLARMALGMFAGRMYAQSVRGVSSVVRVGVGGVVRWADVAEWNGQAEKVRRVEEWAARFLGGVERRGDGRLGGRRAIVERDLPPDTQ